MRHESGFPWILLGNFDIFCFSSSIALAPTRYVPEWANRYPFFRVQFGVTPPNWTKVSVPHAFELWKNVDKFVVICGTLVRYGRILAPVGLLLFLWLLYCNMAIQLLDASSWSLYRAEYMERLELDLSNCVGTSPLNLTCTAHYLLHVWWMVSNLSYKRLSWTSAR